MSADSLLTPTTLIGDDATNVICNELPQRLDFLIKPRGRKLAADAEDP